MGRHYAAITQEARDDNNINNNINQIRINQIRVRVEANDDRDGYRIGQGNGDNDDDRNADNDDYALQVNDDNNLDGGNPAVTCLQRCGRAFASIGVAHTACYRFRWFVPITLGIVCIAKVLVCLIVAPLLVGFLVVYAAWLFVVIFFAKFCLCVTCGACCSNRELRRLWSDCVGRDGRPPHISTCRNLVSRVGRHLGIWRDDEGCGWMIFVSLIVEITGGCLCFFSNT
jgi:hypothetical protein